MSKVGAAHTTDYDVVVIGSGFGGSVSALRLTEKGYRVGVLEAGARFDDPGEPDPGRRHRRLPQTSWRLPRFLWMPRLRCRGIQRVHLIRGRKGSRVLVLAGAGVGGGSLVYANTLYRPGRAFFEDPQWAGIADWESELEPWYDQASRMLGVVDNPVHTPADTAMQAVARRMGAADTFHYTRVGVHFGESGVDPYFGGAGPKRNACVACGSCMTGCREGAKNMLTENYLHLAERAGAEIHPLTTVDTLRPVQGGYRVETVATGSPWRRRRAFTARQVVLAAGTYGTQNLLHRMRKRGILPKLSPRLGALTRTNSEALLGAMRMTSRGADHSRGLAITSSIHPDPHTHVEPVRYGPGANAMGLLSTLLVDGSEEGRSPKRWRKLFKYALRHPHHVARLLIPRGWSRRSVVALVMQDRDNSISVGLRRGGLYAEPGHGEPNPTWIPIGYEATRHLAAELDATPGGTWLDMFDIPATAHFLGGCTIGDGPETGVVDPYHRVWNYPGLHIVDGSAVSANLGVNPSLTITAQAERAMSMWPNASQPDPRPSAGDPYRPVAAVAPSQPVVPDGAPAAWRARPGR